MTTLSLLRTRSHRAAFLLATLGLLSLQVFSGHLSLGQEPIDFAHEILPILQSRCAKCHSNGVFKGGLSLESREKLIESGTVELGAHAKSNLFERITSSDPDEQMPPEGERLSAAQIEKFAAWIDADLVWPAELSLKKKIFTRQLELRAVELPMSESGSDHPIDRIIDEYFQNKSVQPPQRLSDEHFLRRAKMDLLGQLPTNDEIEKFVADQDRLKRANLIDELLSRNRDYADHWMSFWNDLLRNDYIGTGYIDGGRKQITQWLHRSLIENKPYDHFVSELISPTPESAGFIKGIKWRGRVNASQIEPLQFSQNISQVFLGINMKCASCHDSFIDDWKLKDAYGLAAITAEQPLELHRCDVPTGETATSKFVFSSVGEIGGSLPRTQRLEQLARLMTSKKNGRFPRTIVNRLWHRLTGRGLVHPVDIMANEAWSEQLLDFLALDLVQHKYDLKRTLGLIASSRIYQSRSVQPQQATGDFVFRGVEAKRMTAEQFVDAVWSLTDAAPNKVDAAIFLQGQQPAAQWIWSDAEFQKAAAGDVVTFKYEFDLSRIPNHGSAVVACDNQFILFLNGNRVAKGSDWTKPVFVDLKKSLRVGNNVLLVRAINAGDSPNPAALFFEANLAGEIGKSDDLIASGASFEWVRKKFDPKKVSQSLNWQPAVELGDAGQVYKSAQANLGQLVARLRSRGQVNVRAALVNSDPLLRSLGRPNREQVVTTRPETLSTLQALDLSNGEVLTRWLRKGADKWLSLKQKDRWSDQELVSRVFRESLSREATKEEVDLLTPLQSENEVEAIEDLLWMVVMLPEFQLIR